MIEAKGTVLSVDSYSGEYVHTSNMKTGKQIVVCWSNKWVKGDYKPSPDYYRIEWIYKGTLQTVSTKTLKKAREEYSRCNMTVKQEIAFKQAQQ